MPRRKPSPPPDAALPDLRVHYQDEQGRSRWLFMTMNIALQLQRGISNEMQTALVLRQEGAPIYNASPSDGALDLTGRGA